MCRSIRSYIKHWVIVSYYTDQLQGGQKFRCYGVAAANMYYGGHSMSVHTDISVHGWKQVLDNDGTGQAFTDSRIYSA